MSPSLTDLVSDVERPGIQSAVCPKCFLACLAFAPVTCFGKDHRDVIIIMWLTEAISVIVTECCQ